jgi:FAD/FMN-containing dehydrogenase
MVDGPVLREPDEDFAAELAGYNLAAEHPGAVVVGATGTADVCHAVRFAAATGRPVAVRATGHGGTSTRDAVVVTTRRMSDCRVDPASRTATVEAGVRWQQVIEAAAPHGLAPLNGTSPDVGVVGYTLGGGIPMLGRQYGYAADHVRWLEVVTADGQLRRCDPGHDEDLFWGLLGGRDHFGVVTSMEFDLVPVTRLYGGALAFAAADAAAVLRAYPGWSHGLPDEVTVNPALLRLPDLPVFPPPLRGTCTLDLFIASTHSADETEQLLAPIRAVAPTVIDTVREMPYTEVASITNDPTDPAPLWSDSRMLREFGPEAVDALLQVAGPDVDVPIVVLQLRQLGGAFARSPRHPNAVERDGAFVLAAIAPYDPADRTAPAAVGRVINALEPWSTGRPVPNFTDLIRPTEQLRGAWTGTTHERLVQVKRRFDPDNLFRTGFAFLPDEVDPGR